jgi:hypothetical protein
MLDAECLGRLLDGKSWPRQRPGQFPAPLAAKIAAVLHVVEVLRFRLKDDSVLFAERFRRPAPANDGVCMLDMIAADQHQELARITDASFNYGTTA